MEVLACVSIGDRAYIKGDVSFYCYTYEYYLYSFLIGIPALLMWGLITPVVILWRIQKNKDKLDRITIVVRYGYFYKEYTIFYWEFVKMLVKICITLFLQFYETELEIKRLLILLVIAVYYALVIKYSPYKKSQFTKIDQISTMVCFITIFFSILIHAANRFIYIVVVSYFILITLNLWYNVIIIRKIIESYTDKIEILMGKIEDFLVKYLKLKRNSKRINSLDKWKTVRRLTARYLREREREIRSRRQSNLFSSNSFEEYDLESFASKKQIKEFHRKNDIRIKSIESDEMMLACTKDQILFSEREEEKIDGKHDIETLKKEETIIFEVEEEEIPSEKKNE